MNFLDDYKRIRRQNKKTGGVYIYPVQARKKN
jgi:hypothetical protein